MEITRIVSEDVKILEQNAASRDMDKILCTDIEIEESVDPRLGCSLVQVVNDEIGVQDRDQVGFDRAVSVTEEEAILENPTIAAGDFSACVTETVRIRETVSMSADVARVVNDVVAVEDLGPLRRGDLVK